MLCYNLLLKMNLDWLRCYNPSILEVKARVQSHPCYIASLRLCGTHPSNQTEQQLGDGAEQVGRAESSARPWEGGGWQRHTFLRKQSCLGALIWSNSDLCSLRFPQPDSQVRSHPLCSPAAANATTSQLRWLPSMYSSQSITSQITRSFQVGTWTCHSALSALRPQSSLTCGSECQVSAWGWGCSSALIEFLPSMHGDLCFLTSTTD